MNPPPANIQAPRMQNMPAYMNPPAETSLERTCATIAYIALVFVFWTGFTSFIKLPFSLSTWRVMNIIFVFACFPFYKNIRHLKEIKIFIALQALVVIGLLLRCVFAPPSARWMIELTQIIAVGLALGMAPALAGLWYHNQRKVMGAITISMLVAIGYQLFQLITYYFGGPLKEVLPLTLIDTINISGVRINFFRMIGPFYGASGFMHESGHLALFLGPQLGLMLIVWYYNKLNPKHKNIIIAATMASMLLTLSFGGFMQLGIILFLFIILVHHLNEVPVRFYKIFLIFVVVIGVISIFKPTFIMSVLGHLLGRTDEMLAGESARQITGTEYLWEKFDENPIWGFGLSLTFDELNANPNVLIPLTYVTHGAIVGTLVFIMYAVPMLRILFVCHKPLFLVPMLALGIHASMAYGTYRWPSLWATYVLSLCYASTFNLAPNMPLPSPNPTKPPPPPEDQLRKAPLRRREDQQPETPTP